MISSLFIAAHRGTRTREMLGVGRPLVHRHHPPRAPTPKTFRGGARSAFCLRDGHATAMYHPDKNP